MDIPLITLKLFTNLSNLILSANFNFLVFELRKSQEIISIFPLPEAFPKAIAIGASFRFFTS